MTNSEAIKALKANYPDRCYSLLREAVDMAIKALEQPETCAYWERAVNTAIKALEQPGVILCHVSMPMNTTSATEEPYSLDEWCTDCKEYDPEKHCCPRYNRVIRDALKEIQPMRKGVGFDSNEDKYDMIKCPHCKHIFTVDSYHWMDIGFVKDDFKFCPNCGGDMRGEQDE